MSSRTKIVVLHLKELLYTGIFVVLGVLFIVLLVIMFLPDKKQETSDIVQENAYIPGIYTTSIQLGGSTVDIEVVVDENHINSLRLNTLDEAVTTMYPLIEPSSMNWHSRLKPISLWKELHIPMITDTLPCCC